jgi:FAD/FMN-containing dehydrogenase
VPGGKEEIAEIMKVANLNSLTTLSRGGRHQFVRLFDRSSGRRRHGLPPHEQILEIDTDNRAAVVHPG